MKSFTRREFVKCFTLVVSGSCLSGAKWGTLKKVRFGLISDPHYALAAVKWGRYYSESLEKLAEAIDLFNQEGLDFVIETGDFKDQNKLGDEAEELGFLKAVEYEFSKYKGARYHVLGNHDMDGISKQQFLNEVENFNIPRDKSFYTFISNGFKCIVLDTCFRKDEVTYSKGNFDWKDTFMPQSQLNWLKRELAMGEESVIVFVHHLLDGEGDYYVKNSDEVRVELEKSGRVKIVFQGHYHMGGIRTINGIVYYTSKAMVDGSGKLNNSYVIVTMNHRQKILIEGYRRAMFYCSK